MGSTHIIMHAMHIFIRSILAFSLTDAEQSSGSVFVLILLYTVPTRNLVIVAVPHKRYIALCAQHLNQDTGSADTYVGSTLILLE